jgi:hypothetical protein
VAWVVRTVPAGVLRLAPVADLTPAIVDAALLGQAAGGAIADVLANPVTAAALGRMKKRTSGQQSDAAAEELGIDTAATIAGIPVGKLRSLSGGQGLTRSQLEGLLARANDA